MASALIQYLEANDADILLVTRCLLQLQTSRLCSRQEVEERGKELHLSSFIRKTETFPEPALRLLLISHCPELCFLVIPCGKAPWESECEVLPVSKVKVSVIIMLFISDVDIISILCVRKWRLHEEKHTSVWEG